MTRVVNNANVRFSEGYFGWVKFELEADKISEINKKLKLDEEVVRFIIVKAEKGNDIITKDLSILKSDPTIASIREMDTVSEDVNLDTTKDEDIILADNVKLEDIKEIEKVEETLD